MITSIIPAETVSVPTTFNDFQDLTFNEKKIIYEALIKENIQLKATVHGLSLTNAGLLHERQMLTSQLEAQNVTIKDLQRLKEENESLKIQVDELKKEVTVLGAKVSDLEKRDAPITVREAMRLLEYHICLRVVGSKSKMKKSRLYNFSGLAASTDQELQSKKQDVLSDLKLTEEHLNVLAYLKDEGDDAAHKYRPVLSRDDWNDLILEEGDEDDMKQIKRHLLACLEKFVPPSSDGLWNLNSNN